MPLKEGYSPKTVSENIKREVRVGKRKRRQAVAIALDVARRAHRKRKGGRLPKRLMQRVKK